MKRTFTLVEILVVIVVLGIISTVVVIGYKGVIRHTKIAKAKQNISLIVEAEKIYHSEFGSYTTDLGNLENTTGVDFSLDDGDWTYSVSGDKIIATNTNNSSNTINYNLITDKFE